MPSKEDYEQMGAMASTMRAMADDLDNILAKIESGGEKEEKVTEDREEVGPNPSDDADRAVQVIKLSLGR